jgi:hypothetical protein
MPTDPVTENMNLLNMKPVKAFLYQDHQAHIQVHMALMQDPKMQQMMGQNPNAQAMGAAAMAHIQEHLAFEYRKQMEELMGIQLPSGEEEQDGMPRDMEVEISIRAAQAADELLNRNKTEQAAQAAQQAQQDPVIQMQMQELQLKQAEEQRKSAKDQADVQEASARLELERERIASQERIAAAQIQAKAEKEEQALEFKALQALDDRSKPEKGAK